MEPFELLEKAVAVFDELGIPYLVTGSVAAMAYAVGSTSHALICGTTVSKKANISARNAALSLSLNLGSFGPT